MLTAIFFELYKLYCIAGAGITVTAEATVSICSWINLQARRFCPGGRGKVIVGFYRVSGCNAATPG
jgi:hypothetical protein